MKEHRLFPKALWVLPMWSHGCNIWGKVGRARLLTEAQRETLLGELSAAVLHLNEHTRGLDSIIDSEG